MEADKAHILRKVVTVLTLILIFATIGLISITTQVKTITLDYYGNIQTIKTLSSTVDGFLLQNKISVADTSDIYPFENSKITNGMEIKVSQSEKLPKLNTEEVVAQYKPIIIKEEEVIENVPYSEEKKENPTVARGTEQVVQEGVEGKKATKFVVKYSENQELAREKISENVVSPTINKVIEIGTNIPTVASRSAVVKSVAEQVAPEGFKAYNISLPIEQQQYAYNICKKYGVDYELLLAVMYKESKYRPSAIGGGNSYGLCQIHISNHSNLRYKLGISNFLDPYDNMTAGAYMLSNYMSSQGGNVISALNAYNGRVSNNSYGSSVVSIKNRLISNGGL